MSRRTFIVTIGFLCILIVLLLGDFIITNTNTYKNKNIGRKPVEIYNENDNLKNRNLSILIDIDSKLLYLIDTDTNEVVKKYTVATGKPETPSPIGSFKIMHKTIWGAGFGTRWMGLDVPCPTCNFGMRNTRMVGIKGLVL